MANLNETSPMDTVGCFEVKAASLAYGSVDPNCLSAQFWYPFVVGDQSCIFLPLDPWYIVIDCLDIVLNLFPCDYVIVPPYLVGGDPALRGQGPVSTQYAIILTLFVQQSLIGQMEASKLHTIGPFTL